MESEMDIYKNRKFKFNLKLRWVALANIVLLLAIASPSLAQNTISLRSNFPNDPRKLTGEGGGQTSLASIAKIGDNCRGYANTAPNHTVTLTEPMLILHFLVHSTHINDDPTMLIKGPGGITVCADDESNGRLPKVSLSLTDSRLPEGNYQVWVGSKNSNQSFAYTLYLSERPQ
jgi:hypothetical protein